MQNKTLEETPRHPSSSSSNSFHCNHHLTANPGHACMLHPSYLHPIMQVIPSPPPYPLVAAMQPIELKKIKILQRSPNPSHANHDPDHSSIVKIKHYKSQYVLSPLTTSSH